MTIMQDSCHIVSHVEAFSCAAAATDTFSCFCNDQGLLSGMLSSFCGINQHVAPGICANQQEPPVPASLSLDLATL